MSANMDSVGKSITVGDKVAINYLVTPCSNRRSGGVTRKVAFGKVLTLNQRTLGVLTVDGIFLARAQIRSVLKVANHTRNQRSRYALIPLKTHIVRAKILRTTPACFIVEHKGMQFLYRKDSVIRQ